MFEEYGETQLTVCAYAYGWNPGQNVFRHMAKMPFFLVILAKMETVATCLVLRPKQLWIGGGEGSYFFFRDDGSMRKS